MEQVYTLIIFLLEKQLLEVRFELHQQRMARKHLWVFMEQVIIQRVPQDFLIVGLLVKVHGVLVMTVLVWVLLGLMVLCILNLLEE